MQKCTCASDADIQKSGLVQPQLSGRWRKLDWLQDIVFPEARKACMWQRLERHPSPGMLNVPPRAADKRVADGHGRLHRDRLRVGTIGLFCAFKVQASLALILHAHVVGCTR